MRRAVIAVVVVCLALAGSTGLGVYKAGAWVIKTQDDREVSW